MAMNNTALETPPAPPQSHAERRVVLLSILGFWVFYFALNTLKMFLGDHDAQLEMMGRRAGVVVFAVGLTFLMYYVLYRLEGQSTRVLLTAAFLVAVPISFAYAAVNFAAFYLIAPPPSILEELAMIQAKNMGPFLLILDGAVGWYFFIAAWAVLYVALSYAARSRQAERSIATYRAEAQSAQLRALRYQINPHFLFNTLNSLSTLVMRNRNDEADRMIMNLSTFFRTSLTSNPTEDVALSDEIRMQRLYLDIEQIRFPERLMVDVDVPADLENARVPSLILQPVVENAIKHGVARTTAPVMIAIKARANNGSLHLSVENDANGSPEASRNGSGVGLNNVCERLTTRFNGSAACSYGPRPGGGFRVELTMPLQRNA
jgi:two-component system LytT family sensor kinase